jgi:hypothetical protein
MQSENPHSCLLHLQLHHHHMLYSCTSIIYYTAVLVYIFAAILTSIVKRSTRPSTWCLDVGWLAGPRVLVPRSSKEVLRPWPGWRVSRDLGALRLALVGAVGGGCCLVGALSATGDGRADHTEELRSYMPKMWFKVHTPEAKFKIHKQTSRLARLRSQSSESVTTHTQP